MCSSFRGSGSPQEEVVFGDSERLRTLGVMKIIFTARNVRLGVKEDSHKLDAIETRYFLKYVRSEKDCWIEYEGS